MKLKLAFALALLAPLSGCLSYNQLTNSTVTPPGDDSIFVIGLTPDNYRISVWPGHINEHGVFVKSQIRNAAFYGGAQNGYVVFKAKTGDVLAITNARIVNSSKSVFGLDYGPRCDTLVFKVPKGQAVYLGDVAFTPISADGHIAPSVSDHFEAARHFISASFPAIKQPLVDSPFMHMPTLGCVE